MSLVYCVCVELGFWWTMQGSKNCNFLLHEFLTAFQSCFFASAAHREIAHCALDVHHLVYNELEKKVFFFQDDEGPVIQKKMSDMITIFAELFHNLPALTFRCCSFTKSHIFQLYVQHKFLLVFFCSLSFIAFCQITHNV